MSRIGRAQGLASKLDEINADFAKLARTAHEPIGSTLTLANIYRHHARLIAPLVESGSMNDKEANVLRDAAISIEDTDPEAALVMMQAAHLIRPKGVFIAQKLRDYEADLQKPSIPGLL